MCIKHDCVEAAIVQFATFVLTLCNLSKNACSVQDLIVNPRFYVLSGLNHVSAGLNRFKPHVRQKQVSAGRNPTLI